MRPGSKHGHPIAVAMRVLARGCVKLMSALWPSARTRRAIVRALRAAPMPLRLSILGLVLIAGWACGNWLYQVARKPSELLFPFDGRFAKRPEQLWHAYAPSFRAHSTALITPAFLAALAYVESAGDPVARTYWRWQLSWNPLRWYMPASSAVGMYQLTDATFEEMKRYCIHDHEVVQTGPWYDPSSCWFNAFYMRALPNHAIELTSAYLDLQVRNALGSGTRATAPQKRNLAAVIHLCGPAAGRAFAQRGFRADAGKLCGDHPLGDYLARIENLQATFARLQQR